MTVLVWNCLESSSLFPFFIVLLLAIILVFLTPLLCDRNLTSHCIAWLAECERAKWNVPSANSNQGRFSISMNQIFAICRKNSHALNSLPLKWIYKCMSEYVKECKVGECKEWFTYTKIRCKGAKNRHFFRMFCNIIGSQVPHSSGKASLMSSAFVKVTLRTDFVHKAVDYCNVSNFDLDFDDRSFLMNSFLTKYSNFPRW